MREFRLIDAKKQVPVISIEEALQMESYLIIGRSELQFAVYSSNTSDPVFISHIPIMDSEEGLMPLFWEHPLLSLPFKVCHVSIVDDGAFVVVPDDLIESAGSQQWLGVSTDMRGRKVQIDPIPEERLSVVYSIRKELFDFCLRSFPSPLFFHSITALIKQAVRLSRRESPHLLVAYAKEGQLQTVVASEGQLLLANRYRVATDEDILYYVTALYRQFKFNPQHDPLYLYTDNSSLDPKLNGYVSQLKINEYPNLNADRLIELSGEQLHPAIVLNI